MGDAEFWGRCAVAVGAVIVLAYRVLAPSLSSDETDLNDNCAFWAANNECVRNPVYMLNHCRKSCKAQALAVVDSADVRVGDAHDVKAAVDDGEVLPLQSANLTPAHPAGRCATWAARGECDASVAFMQLHCPHECNLGVPDMHRHCRYWAQNGECLHSVTFMQHHCPASCDRYFRGLHVAVTNAYAGNASLRAPRCPPQADRRGDCEALAGEGRCASDQAVEMLQRCFYACSVRDPDSVLALLRRYPDPWPPGSGREPDPAKVDVPAPRTTLRSVCMGGVHRPGHEDLAGERLRLLRAFGVASLAFCTARHHAMTPRVLTASGQVRHVERVVVAGEASPRMVSVHQVADVPRVRILDNLLTADEAAAVLAEARPHLRKMAGAVMTPAAASNASSAFLPSGSAAAHRVSAIVAHFAGVAPSHVEHIQVVHYPAGTASEQHFDYLDSCDLSARFTGANAPA